MEQETAVHPWIEAAPPSEAAIRQRLAAAGLQPYSWSNGPGDVYAAHAHPFHKVLYVVSGTISFGFPAIGRKQMLPPGDRLELPPGVQHEALVGPQGVICLEAHRL